MPSRRKPDPERRVDANKTPSPPPTPPSPQRQRRRRRQDDPEAAEPVLNDAAPPVEENHNEGRPPSPPHIHDVFDAPAHADAHHVHFDAAGESKGEYFPSLPLSAHSSTDLPPRTPPTQAGRHRRSPRAGPHASPTPARRKKATGGRSASAQDVWTFFESVGPVGKENRESRH
ncbi:hypothetical protein K438DRAFT_1784587 [Mycena galopus ATCC 62051]|nr:hypothetical protein K438DRAFT_1784587 [Mycena galopus ATCC 62051]